jgi:hypothetical protein
MKISVPENLRNYKLIDTSVFTKGECIIVQSAYELDSSKFNNCLICDEPIVNKRADAKTCSDLCRKKLSLKRGEISQ